MRTGAAFAGFFGSRARTSYDLLVRRRISWLACLVGLWLGRNQVHAQVPTGELSPAVRATLEAGIETPELRALREFEEQTFGAEARAARSQGNGPAITATTDVGFLAGAVLPDMPARWDDAVIEYLRFFRDDPRGRELMRAWFRRGQRYDAAIRTALRENGAPEDLRCVALAESGFDPTVRSPVGALGMWQFMPDTGRQYGLTSDRWVDERMDPSRSTAAAARYLRDLQRRFGSWELALAAYNMGYGALLRAIRKYNTNDYATLARIEAGLPFETTVYVSKIVACGIVLRNPDRFGLTDVARDEALDVATVSVRGATPLTRVAELAGVSVDDLRRLNPHLLHGMVPPNRNRYDVRIPSSARSAYETAAAASAPTHRSVVMRFGERLRDVAERHGIDEAALRSLNDYRENERVLGPVALGVPNVEARAAAPASERPTVPVPDATARVAGRTRIFYRVIEGDTLDDVKAFFDVTDEELRSWNVLDPAARLQSGMTLQIFTPTTVDLSQAVVLAEDAVRVVVAGSEEFFDWHETQRGRVRVRYRVQTGDTLSTLGQRFGLTLGDIARINRLSRTALLRAGQELIVYTSRDIAATLQTP